MRATGTRKRENVCSKKTIVKEREKTEEKTREETGKLLLIARNDNMSVSLKKLKRFL